MSNENYDELKVHKNKQVLWVETGFSLHQAKPPFRFLENIAFYDCIYPHQKLKPLYLNQYIFSCVGSDDIA